METIIQGSNNFTVSQDIKNYLLKRIEKLNYFKSHIDKIVFHLNSEKLIYKISATLSIKKIGIYKFEADADEMYTAIDMIVHKMDIKINREKSKIQQHNNPGHEAVIDFFYEHEKNNPEPTKNFEIYKKPLTLIDAYMQMENENYHIFGFNLISENSKITPAFLRKIDEDMVYFLQQIKDDTYSEFPLKILKNKCKEGKKIRDIKLKQMNLLDAQKNILNQEYHYDIYYDNNNQINFLIKEDNGKWLLIS